MITLKKAAKKTSTSTFMTKRRFCKEKVVVYSPQGLK